MRLLSAEDSAWSFLLHVCYDARPHWLCDRVPRTYREMHTELASRCHLRVQVRYLYPQFYLRCLPATSGSTKTLGPIAKPGGLILALDAWRPKEGAHCGSSANSRAA